MTYEVVGVVLRKPSTTTIICPVPVEVDYKVGELGEGDPGGKRIEPCGGEVLIEWDQNQLPPEKTGRMVCSVCDADKDKAPDVCVSFEGDEGEHEWVEEYQDGAYVTELISLRTWCWHVITKQQVEEILNDQWAAGAERAAER